MINILYSLKLRNCSKTPEVKQTKKLSPPPPNQNQTNLFYIMELTTLKYSEKFKNIYKLGNFVHIVWLLCCVKETDFLCP